MSYTVKIDKFQNVTQDGANKKLVGLLHLHPAVKKLID